MCQVMAEREGLDAREGYDGHQEQRADSHHGKRELWKHVLQREILQGELPDLAAEGEGPSQAN
eukprot:CAMPEP_0181496650 /NCGR_PEP_ID=MMETSP1110-20121109/53100_1 /TAXON_ID=174948 /ORGANISM="Symbiodinium sp., Strain CCMP421" /LENGTH=62 /DNA_ID=CAMNT_0023624507 /DNA_START=217 /DNA_END=405 /DNA_ORIENTATION=-